MSDKALGLCECGCGQATELAPRNSRDKGWIKGQPVRFVYGHNRRRYHEPPSGAVCHVCSHTKPAESFYVDRSRPTGLSSACRECAKAKSRARYAEDPNRSRVQVKRWIANNPDRYRDINKRGRYKRRARLKNVRVERFSPREIYERDGWRCHICGDLVSEADASLDHLTPISQGGDHVRLNVRLAHSLCNVKRGVDRIPAQLILI